SDHDDRGKTKILPQRARRVAHILQRLLQPNESAFVASTLLDLLDAAELSLRGEARLVDTHTGGAVALGLQLEMEAHLLRHLGVEVLFPEQRAELVKPAHRRAAQAFFRTSRMVLS